MAVKEIAKHEGAFFVDPAIFDRGRDFRIVVSSKKAHFPSLGVRWVDRCGKSPTCRDEIYKVLVCGNICGYLLQELSMSILQR